MTVDGLSGGVAAFITNLLFHPLENIRTRLQDYKGSEESIEDGSQKSDGKKKSKKSFSAFHYLYKLWEKEGINAFYSGLGITCGGAVITFAIYFFWYRFWKVAISPNSNALDTKKMIIITALAGSITNALTSPIWKIQTRMCVSKEQKSIYQHFKDAIEESGVIGLWKGFFSGLVLVINPVINFGVYEKLRTLIIKDNSQVPSAKMIFLISLVSKFIATFATYPVLTLKTKEFTDKKGGSTFTILNDFLKEEGFFALYRGIYAKLFQTLLNNALMMMAFEKIKAAIEARIN
mmetsp:Transcript_17294/g.16956  ORF Transcript_17294/g.16956 Transcript_17294/m.16956 type:complete len:291 (-) Transcript_17294:29-901(-)